MVANAITQFIAKARRFTPLRGGEMELPVRMTPLESLAVAQTEPEGMELTRSGRRVFLGNNAAITGIAVVQALPTTAAQWVIWNADAQKTYFFEEIGAYLTSGTPALGGLLLGTIFRTPAQVGASATGTALLNGSGGNSRSNAIVKSGVTITDPAAPVWYFLANNPAAGTPAAFPGAGAFFENRDIRGRLAVPPGYGLGLAIVATDGTTELFAPFASWVEIETDME